MDQNHLAGQGQGYLHHQYGHHQEEYQQHQHQFDPQSSYDNYNSGHHQHMQQYSPEYSGTAVLILSFQVKTPQIHKLTLSISNQSEYSRWGNTEEAGESGGAGGVTSL